ncbi:MAG: tagaturonate reductase, partial [Prevotellaceae bacterium]|nr:tagaturonate reductase [Prevotellaceae bacterium]
MKALDKQTAPKAQRPERIIQFGEGNFLRAFADWIVYNMNERTDFNSSVVVVQPIEKGMVDRLNAQDNLYHVNLQGLDKGEAVNSLTLIDVISRSLNPYTQYEAFMQLAMQPEMRFVISNTTEAGIAFDPACRLTDAPASSYPGKLTQLLYRRYQAFGGDTSKGLLIFPCELIFLNGHKLKETIYQYIELWQLGEAFKRWFTEACGVYATLVDRIVPGFPRKEIAAIKEQLQYDDNLVVQAEVFHLWVIEAPQSVADEFPAHKAGLNVLFVPSEAPYHERKVTLLNGPHTVLSPVAYLSGVDIVRDACQHPVIGKYIHRVMFDELMQTLNLPPEELKQFAQAVLDRFNNPFVDHAVTSIMLNSFPKYQTRDLPGLKTYLQRKGVLPQGLVLGLAAIITYYKGGTRADGAPIAPNDAPEIMQLLT